MKHVTGVQNVTITLPREIIQEAKHAAVDEGLSLSAFVAKILEERLERAVRYREAMEREKRAMREGIGGVMGEVTWTRDELHER